eukprot:8408365-Alexandrium_andersonii.AAC.1
MRPCHVHLASVAALVAAVVTVCSRRPVRTAMPTEPPFVVLDLVKVLLDMGVDIRPAHDPAWLQIDHM